MFGHKPKLPQITPQLGEIMRQDAGIRETRPAQGAAQPQKTGLFGQGSPVRAIAGTIGDVLLQRGGLAPIYAPNMQRQQLLAEQQRQASLGRENDWQDWVRKEQWKRDNPTPENPYRFEDNAGNVYERRGGSNELIFTDPNERKFVVDGQLITVPNVVRAGQQPATPQPGALVNGFRFRGGDPKSQSSWEPVNQPQPTGGNHMNAAQWQTIIQRFGPAGAEEYRRKHNIEVR